MIRHLVPPGTLRRGRFLKGKNCRQSRWHWLQSRWQPEQIGFLTAAAVIGARVAAERVAADARAQAFAAEQVAAAIAGVLVVLADNVSAIGAGLPFQSDSET